MGDALNDSIVCLSCGVTKRKDPRREFKINTKCYHRVCQKCLDREYRTGGKQRCPAKIDEVRCTKEVWQRDWRIQTFEDLQLEREIEIRKRVFQILARQEDDFVSKRDYDDFLEQREEIVMNLSLNTNASATNRKLRDYQLANNIIIDKDLESASQKDRRSKRKHEDEIDASGLIRGLRKAVKVEPLAPYDPFMGLPKHWDYFSSDKNYASPYDSFKKDEKVVAAGYNLQDALEESLVRAFAGLGVFVEEEKLQMTKVETSDASVMLKQRDDVF